MKKFLVMFGIASLLLFVHNIGASAASNTYTVKKGDTLYQIAKTYKISLEELIQWNKIKADSIQPNQKLIVMKVTSSSKTKKATVVKTITVSASAYTASCKNCSGITTMGFNLQKNPSLKIISVDPKVIKLGTRVYVEGYGYAIAGDKGSAIKGNKIDVFIPSLKGAIQWGRKTVKVQILI
jgi:3D (Asp-Asp-Asp) domain-containing protein